MKGLAALLAGLATLGAGDLPREEFEKLHAELTKPDLWESIP